MPSDTLPLPPLAARLMGAAEYLTARQIALLATVAAHPFRSTGEIAAALGVAAPVVTRNMETLRQMQLAEAVHDGCDRRRRHLTATMRGEALLAEVEAAS